MHLIALKFAYLYQLILSSLFTVVLGNVQNSNHVKIEPAVATSYNLKEIVQAMNKQGIQRAQVSGWNDHLNVYVVHSNGAVTPQEPLDMPNVAVFFKKYKNCKVEIIFMSICDNVIEQPIVEEWKRPVLQVCPPVERPCMEEWKRPVPPVSPCECPPLASPPKFVPQECSSDRVSKSESQCNKQRPNKPVSCFPPIRHCKGKPGKGPSHNKKKVCECKKEFIFSNECVRGRNVPVLTMDAFKGCKSRSVVYLNNGAKVGIAILNNPALLLKIKLFAESKLRGPVVLYVDPESRVYVSRNNMVYLVLGKNNQLRIVPLSAKTRARVNRLGMFSVKFD